MPRLPQVTPWLIAAGFAAAALAACATQPPQAADGPGFWLGCFHGATAILVVVTAPFTHLRIYAFPNDGFQYDMGFCLGFVTSLIAFILSVIPRIGGWLAGRD